MERLLKSKSKFLLPDIIMAEIVWVLDSFYKWERAEIVESMSTLIRLPSIVCSRFLLSDTLNIFKEHKSFDFADAYSVALMKSLKIKDIYSFDRDFDKIPGVNRLEPK